MKQAILFSLFWFIAGAAIGLGLQSLYGVNWIISCGALNMAIGLVLLLLVTRNERAYRAFYGEGEQGGLRLAVLVSFPVVLLFLGVLWWLLGKIFPL